MPMILQPLKNVRLVVLALLANFVLGAAAGLRHHAGHPARAVAQGRLDRAGHGGGRALPAQVGAGRQGQRRLWRGLMVLLMVVTIIYMPLVLPLLLPGVSVNPWDIAKSLIVLMLVPLAIGLLIKSHSPDYRGRLAAGDGQDLQPGHPRAARGRAGAERLQHHRPDWHGRPPGAAAVHRRVAADRPAAGRARRRASAA